MSSSPLPPPRLPRRTATGLLALGALAATGATAGCDLDEVLERPRAAPEQDADDRLATEMAAAIAAARTLAATRPRAGDWVALHDAHLAALGGSAGPSGAPPTAGQASLRAVETALQRTLSDAAVRAESGALARTLGAMAAGVAQQLAGGV